jgi:N-acetylmuramoyl-L-alanine amidase
MVSDFIQKNINILRIVLMITFLLYYLSFTANAHHVNNYLNVKPKPTASIRSLWSQIDEAIAPIGKKRFKIVIDAGHGGHDPGAVGKRSKEKDLVLQMSNKLGAMIETKYPEVEVLLTRTTDVFIPLFRRIQFANEEKADLFISIHCNFISHPNTRGTETFVMGVHRAADNLEVAKRENASILLEANYEQNYDGYNPNSTEGHIMMSMYQNAYLEKSIQFAADVESNFASNKVSKSRGVKQAGFAVLRRAAMPAVLVEAGFLSNDQEEEYLMSPEGQSQVVESILRAFNTFYTHHKSSPSTPESTKAVVEHKETKESKTSVPTSKAEKIYNDPASLKYLVQIAAAKGEVIDMDTKELRAIGKLEIMKYNDLNKYLVGSFTDKDQAMEARDRLIKIGYKGAFIVTVSK